uniref:Peptidase S59 domain-containing protein n=1 Tax=Arcella intermedia TaxID=1963864 RepID=A0A6B2KWK9_9EUKA
MSFSFSTPGTSFGGGFGSQPSTFGSFGSATTGTGFGTSSTPSFNFGSSSTGSLFGSGTSGGAFGSTSSTPSFGSGFGTSSTQPSAFSGFSGSSFGGSSFGSGQTSSFGSTPSGFGSTTGFGSTPSPGFGSSGTGFGSTPSPSGFGSSGSLFGSSPSFGGGSSFGSSGGFGSAAPSSGFGSTGFGTSSGSSFGSTPSSSFTTFGTSSSSSFGSSSTGFSFGPSTGFGSSSTPTAGGFGSGSTPSSSFGTSFGTSSAFGTSTPSFGATSTSSSFPSFGSFATGGSSATTTPTAPFGTPSSSGFSFPSAPSPTLGQTASPLNFGWNAAGSVPTQLPTPPVGQVVPDALLTQSPFGVLPEVKIETNMKANVKDTPKKSSDDSSGLSHITGSPIPLYRPLPRTSGKPKPRSALAEGNPDSPSFAFSPSKMSTPMAEDLSPPRQSPKVEMPDSPYKTPVDSSPSRVNVARVKCSKNMYTIPPIEVLQKMDAESLRRVPAFGIGKLDEITKQKVGEVRFHGETDVLGLDLDRIVFFKEKAVEVYPVDCEKPPVGQNLNKPAQIFLYNCYPKSGDVGAYEEFLRHKCKTLPEKTEFVSYDPKNGEWVFIVEHFTKYGLEDDEDEVKPPPKLAPKQTHPVTTSTLPSTTGPPKTAEAIPKPSTFSYQSPAKGPKEKPARRGNRFGLFTDSEDEEPKVQKEPIDENEEMSNPASDEEGKFKAPVVSVPSRIQELSTFGLFQGSPKSTQIDSVPMDYYPTDSALEYKMSEEKMEMETPQSHPALLHPLNKDTTADYVRMWPYNANLHRSFRVGWSPDGSLIIPVAKSNENTIKIGEIRIIKMAPSGDKEEEEKMLLSHKKHTKKESGIITPTFVPRDQMPASLIQEYKRMLTPNSSAYETLELVEALFGSIPNLPPHTHEFERKFRFNNWLKQTLSKNTIQKRENVGDLSLYQDLFLLISVKKIEEAVQLAIKNKLYRLAALIAQAGARNGEFQQEIGNQLRGLKDKDELTIAKKNLFLLLSGDIKALCDSDIDWKRALALHFWFFIHHPLNPHSPLSDIFNNFKNFFMTESREHTVQYYLIDFFSNPRLGVDRKFLNPDPSDPLNYSIVWKIQNILEALHLEKVPLREPFHSRVTMDYASQLECLGLWEWSIYVILNVRSIGGVDASWRKKDAIQAILHRNAQHLEKKMDFLKEMGISDKLMYSALALWQETTGNYDLQVECLIKSEEWDRAHKVFTDRLLARLFIEEHSLHPFSKHYHYKDPEQIQWFQNLKILSSHNVLDWNGRGCIYYKYVCVLKEFIFCEALFEVGRLLAKKPLRKLMSGDWGLLLDTSSHPSRSLYQTIKKIESSRADLDALSKVLSKEEALDQDCAMAKAKYQTYLTIIDSPPPPTEPYLSYTPGRPLLLSERIPHLINTIEKLVRLQPTHIQSPYHLPAVELRTRNMSKFKSQLEGMKDQLHALTNITSATNFKESISAITSNNLNQQDLESLLHLYYSYTIEEQKKK